MTLIVSVDNTRRFKQKYKNKYDIVIYKTLLLDECGDGVYRLVTPYRCTRVSSKDKYLKSDRTSNELHLHETPSTYGKLKHGIHCYIKSNYAPDANEISVKAYASINDFVAIGSDNDHAVFTKIRLDKQDLRKQLNKFKKEKIVDLKKSTKKEINYLANNLEDYLKSVKETRKEIRGLKKELSGIKITIA